MPLMRLIVLTNAVDGKDEDFNTWYTGRHLGDVLAVDGFVAAQRFAFTPGKLGKEAPYRYLAIYEVEADSVEEAEQALLTAAGDESRMPISEAMARGRATWWFTEITERVEAAPAR
jgi:hypothetical protein